MMDLVPQRDEPIRVLLIDVSAIVLHGLKEALSKQNGIVVAGTARSELEAQQALQTCRPNVVILDVEVGRTSGINLCRTIHQSHPNVGVLFFTAKDDANFLRSAIGAGARGYLLKSASVEVLLKSIEAVAIGRAMVDPDLTHQVLTWIRDGVGVASQYSLADSTVEDLSLLSRVAAGKTNKDIARELDVDQSVIASRLQRIYKHLRISRRTEAVSYFLKYERERHPELHHDVRYDASAVG
jgi:two-component system response regulator DevR